MRRKPAAPEPHSPLTGLVSCTRPPLLFPSGLAGTTAAVQHLKQKAMLCRRVRVGVAAGACCVVGCACFVPPGQLR